jgi:hypothetical protein
MVILGLFQSHMLRNAPTTPDATHTYPFATKHRGTVYLTDGEHWLGLLTFGVMGVFAVTAAVSAWDYSVKRRNAKLATRQTLERFDGWHSGG